MLRADNDAISRNSIDINVIMFAWKLYWQVQFCWPVEIFEMIDKSLMTLF